MTRCRQDNSRIVSGGHRIPRVVEAAERHRAVQRRPSAGATAASLRHLRVRRARRHRQLRQIRTLRSARRPIHTARHTIIVLSFFLFLFAHKTQR